MNDKETQRIRDPVHGLIVFGGGNDAHQNETDRIAWRLLNTREFQRLRRIRQLGFSDLVYPGATHSRLAHAIGVYHTARRLIEVIRRRQDETHEDKERERVVLLAALLHDIGHGPFSHVFEHAPYQPVEKVEISNNSTIPRLLFAWTFSRFQERPIKTDA